MRKPRFDYGRHLPFQRRLLIRLSYLWRLWRHQADADILVDAGRIVAATRSPGTAVFAIYVADAWNQRIQKLGPDLAALAEWPTYSWASTDRYHKPYLAVDSQGRVYASDPSMYRVFVYAPDGQLQATFGNFGPELNRFGLPNGLAIDPTTGQLLVADADNQRVMLFPSVSAYQ